MLKSASNILPHPPNLSALPIDEHGSPSITLPPPTSLRASKGHQRSRTTVDPPPLFHSRTPSTSPTRSSTFLPFLRSARDRSISPERVSVKEAAEFAVITPPEQVPERPKGPGKVEKIASWFDGASDPVRVQLVPSPSKEALNPLSPQDSMERLFSASSESVDTFTKRPQKRPALGSHSTQASSSRFSFFRKPSQTQIRLDPSALDELAELDIRAALYPSGVVDEFSPAAFKNLQLNAEGTLHRMQNAYRENLRGLRQMHSEKNIEADELEASQIRNEHLKLQLTDMAEMAASQEKTIAALREELAWERRRIERQNIRLVTNDAPADPMTPKRNYRKNRISDVSSCNESESSSDSSAVESVFSEPMYGYSPGTSISESPVLRPAIMFKPPTFSSSPRREHTKVQVLECGKCHGVKESEAWDVIGIMKMESMALKERIEELEVAQDDALDFVNGLRWEA